MYNVVWNGSKWHRKMSHVSVYDNQYAIDCCCYSRSCCRTIIAWISLNVLAVTQRLVGSDFFRFTVLQWWSENGSPELWYIYILYILFYVIWEANFELCFFVVVILLTVSKGVSDVIYFGVFLSLEINKKRCDGYQIRRWSLSSEKNTHFCIQHSSIHGYFLYETDRYVVVNLHGLYVKKYSVSRSTFRFIAEIDVEVNRHLKLNNFTETYVVKYHRLNPSWTR